MRRSICGGEWLCILCVLFVHGHPVCLSSCASPQLTTTGLFFDVVVSVGGVQSRSQLRWQYQPPFIDAVLPGYLSPMPASNATLTVHGGNFGTVRGTVTVARHVAVCDFWTDASISCLAPRGVAANATVTVTAASGLASLATPGAIVHYLAPTVEAVTVNVSDTVGGALFTLTGVNLNDGVVLPTSIWLSRGVLPSPPWSRDTNATERTLLRCDVVKRVVPSSTTLSGYIPAGYGTGWVFVVVNHDVDLGGTLSMDQWQTSAVSAGVF